MSKEKNRSKNFLVIQYITAGLNADEKCLDWAKRKKKGGGGKQGRKMKYTSGT